MLFITPMASAQGAKDYFSRQLWPSDYYLRDLQEQAGEWHGLGAQLLGLKGQVTRDEFFSLCDNLDPKSGDALTQRSKVNRRVAYDFTFDAPKSVTLALELGGDERILDAFRASVDETMQELEADMHTRVRRGGADSDRRTSNLIWADFLHRTARPVDGVPDPQLHCHAVAFNATYDSDEGRWKAGQFAPLVRDKLYYQAAFHSRLAERLTALGYGVHREGTSFGLDGVSRETVLRFSRRLQQIDAEASRLGVVDPESRAALGRSTRDAKAGGASLAELRAAWRLRVTDGELHSIEHARSSPKPPPVDGAEKAAAFAIAHGFERESVVPERRLVAEALMQSVGCTRVADVLRGIRKQPLVRRVVEGQVLATTEDVYREEVAMLRYARDGRGKCKRLGGAGEFTLDSGLSDEQRAAALSVLGSRDRVIGLRGGAGTGKTRTMQATVQAIERSGKRVFAFAPSAKASRGVLREEGFGSADTVERLLTDKDLHRQVQGQVVWIDEAGLLGTRDMRRVFDLARKEGFRIVLSGDSKQHSSVGRGDALRLLESEAGLPFAELKSIRRQATEEYREAVREIALGDARGRDGRAMLAHGLDRLDRAGAIVEASGEERLSAIARDYAEATAPQAGGQAATALVVSPTHREAEKVADRIRQELRLRGRLGSEERTFLSLKGRGLTEAQRASAEWYGKGDVIRFHQNAKGFKRGERVTVADVRENSVIVVRADGRRSELALAEAKKFDVYEARELALARGDRLRISLNGTSGSSRAGSKQASGRFNNGDLYEVAGFTPEGDIRLTNGRIVAKDYGGLAQGYVVTSHASQGATVDRVLIALGSESLAAANRQQFYVSVSRGRHGVKLYTDDKDALAAAIERDASRLSAAELLGTKRSNTARPGSVGRLVSLQRARRHVHAWHARQHPHFHWQEGRHVGR